VGLSKEYSINELLDIIIETDGFKDARIVHLSSKPTTVNKRTVDLTKAKKVLGFEAKTSIREGVARMIEWYRNNPVVDN
jgi:nucleoside-diphosphate-sugar epimerase